MPTVANLGEKLVRNRDLSFSADLPPSAIPIRADADVLRRALLILIDNAAKYTPQGGSVRLRLAAQIFDRFWRADKTRSREQGGAGLGLSIAKWIVEMHTGAAGRLRTRGVPML